MGRGRMTSGGGGGRGSMTSGGRIGGGHHHSTVIIGHHGYYRSGGSPLIGIIVGVIFAIVGFVVICMGIGQAFAVTDYSKVTAVCVANEENKVDGGYFARYTFVVDGKQYANVRSNQSWVATEDIGAEVIIYYLEDDPRQIYEKCPVSVKEGALIAGFGLIFATVGTIPLIISIKEIKRKKQKSNSQTTEEPQSVRAETYNRCPYCGARYSKNLSSCPKCGASRID